MKALVVLCLLAVCCATIDTSKKEQGKTSGAGSWETHEPASVAESKVSIIYRGQFATDDDFYYSVTVQIEWLWTHSYEVISLEYKYGFDMTRNLILRFAVIKYRGKEWQLKQKRQLNTH